jgi:predicted O-linked N-acetylglucosamine transferase (SPINDLY family)
MDGVELAPPTDDYTDHLRTYERIDIALDTFPYNGTTTTCEALWMGVPVITLAGDRHAACVGASLLDSVGLPNLVAESPQQYVSIAKSLATDLPALARLRAELRSKMLGSPLCDGVSLAREVERAYRSVWRDWCVASPR